MKSRWLVAGMAGVIGSVIVAGALFADDSGASSTPLDNIRDRVAQILGIDRSTLDDAYAQARDQIKDEKRAEQLARLVEQGVITQEQADEIAAWEAARPSVLDEIGPKWAPKPGVMPFGGRGFSPAVPPMHGPVPSAEQLQGLLDAAVESGRISAEDAAAITAWLEARPGAVDQLVPPPPAPGEPSFGAWGHGPRGRFEFRFRGPGGHFQGSAPAPPDFQGMPDAAFGFHTRPGVEAGTFGFGDLDGLFSDLERLLPPFQQAPAPPADAGQTPASTEA